ncbi:MAG: RNA polymerase sigma factor [Myxococcota bacterium]
MLAGAAISRGAPRAREPSRPRWGELVPAAARGDVDATRRLLHGIGPRVLQTVRRVLGYGALANDAEDVAQESLLAVLRALPGLREPTKVVAFATRTAVRNALRHRRRGEGGAATVELDAADTVVDDSEGPAEALVARRRAAMLLSLLDELPDAQSEALALRFCLGHSLEEAAEVMQCPVNTVRSRVRLGREALAAKLKKRAATRELLGGGG